MLPTEFSIAQFIADNITNIFSYSVLSLLISILLYLIIIPIAADWPHSYKLTVALVMPFFILELILTQIFKMFGIVLNWGNYVYHFPFFGDIVVTSGVQVSRLLDTLFNFGIFRILGQPYFTEFIKTIPAVLPDYGILFKGFVAIYVSADTLIDFAFFYFFFMALIVVFDDVFNNDMIIGLIVAIVSSLIVGYLLYAFLGVGLYMVAVMSIAVFVILFAIFHANIRNAGMYASGLALIPVAIYNYFVSNPFLEYGEAVPQLQKVYYFWQHADGWSLFMYFGTLVISFLIVMEILASVIDLFYRVGSSTISPSLQGRMWTENYQGRAFGFTLAFGIMYALHEYYWYVFFPALILYGLFKKMSGGIIETAKIRGEKMELQQANVGNREKKEVEIPQSTGQVDARGGGLDIGMVLVIIGIVGLLVLAWTRMG